MLDKSTPPCSADIAAHLGDRGGARLLTLESFLEENYQLKKELRFPFGGSYGWGYKYCHKNTHLCYVFFESGAITVTIQLGDRCVPAVQEAFPSFLPRTKELWEGRYPCGDSGGWVHYRILSDSELEDICTLIRIKKKPVKPK